MCNSNPAVYCDIIASFVCCSSVAKWSIFSGIEHILWVQPFVCPWGAHCILKHTVCPCKCAFLCVHEQCRTGKSHSFFSTLLRHTAKSPLPHSRFWEIVRKGFWTMCSNYGKVCFCRNIPTSDYYLHILLDCWCLIYCTWESYRLLVSMWKFCCQDPIVETKSNRIDLM